MFYNVLYWSYDVFLRIYDARLGLTMFLEFDVADFLGMYNGFNRFYDAFIMIYDAFYRSDGVCMMVHYVFCGFDVVVLWL